MKTLLQAALFAAVAVSIPGSVTAQAVSTQPGAGSAVARSDGAAQQAHLYRGSKIIGSSVRDPKDKKIGKIKDLLLDSGRGEVAYAVVSFGGATGAGSKYHAIPWQAMQPSDDGKYYVLYADRETIIQAPSFDKTAWPDMADRKWSAEIDRYWSRMVGRGTFGNSLSPPGAAGVPKASGGDGGRAGQGSGNSAAR